MIQVCTYDQGQGFSTSHRRSLLNSAGDYLLRFDKFFFQFFISIFVKNQEFAILEGILWLKTLIEVISCLKTLRNSKKKREIEIKN